MPNHLIHETSPYLLQHADNPVDWFPWSDEALAKARRENKPIFLSIGYAACHWCHVMERESFTDAETAQMLNQYFVSIKVDREERPDIDSIYLGAVMAMTGQGGWPTSVFLTPEGRPFYGGTYFPPVRRYGMPSFKEVLNSIIRSWGEGKAEIYRVADRLANHLRDNSAWSGAAGHALDPEILARASHELIESYDAENGGWGGAPKFPQPMAIEFLLQQASRGDARALEIATDSLRAMQRGGIYDVIGGGFHRYSTDAHWLVPHFEKMLYDNAQLALAYLHAYLLTGETSFQDTCTETLDFIARELTHPQGGFFSSLDADSEGEEGKYYLWTDTEIREALDDPSYTQFAAAYEITPHGNFEGHTILRRPPHADGLREGLISAHARLLETRSKRIRPATDDKILTAWNALTLCAFAEAARYLKRSDYLQLAQNNASFLLDHLYQDGRLLRAWRAGQARHNAYLEDYAALVMALLTLYQSDPNPHWFQTAKKLAIEMIASFSDARGGFFTTRHDHGELIFRPKEVQDNATPSGNALAVRALLLLDAFDHNSNWRDLAETMLAGIQDVAVRYPAAFGYWLQALDFAIGPVTQLALVFPTNQHIHDELLAYINSTYRPRSVLAISSGSLQPAAPALLQDRPAREARPTVYVCAGFVCNLPVTTLEGLKDQLG